MQTETISHSISDAEETRFVEMVFPEQANHYGTLYGGTALSLMGKAAFVAASRHARCTIVMAASKNVMFCKPVKVGQIAELIARITRMGKSSMTIAVEVIAETLTTGERALAVHGEFEMVSVDANGQPTPIIRNCQA